MIIIYIYIYVLYILQKLDSQAGQRSFHWFLQSFKWGLAAQSPEFEGFFIF